MESDWIATYFSFGNFSLDLLKRGATYRIELDSTSEEIVSTTWDFTEEVELPIVSLSTKGKSKKLDVEFLDDGSMVVRWNAPAATYEENDIDTSVVVYLTIKEEKEEGGLLKIVYTLQSTHLGMVIIPPSVIDKLQDDPDYQGFFDFLIQHHTKDQCNRTYSNSIRYWF